jgi:hypothetical protein
MILERFTRRYYNPSQICRAPEVLHRHGVDPV